MASRIERTQAIQTLYAVSVISTLRASQIMLDLNLWCKPEVCDASWNFVTAGF